MVAITSNKQHSIDARTKSACDGSEKTRHLPHNIKSHPNSRQPRQIFRSRHNSPSLTIRELLQPHRQIIDMNHSNTSFNKVPYQLHTSSQSPETHISICNNWEHVVEVLERFAIFLAVSHSQLSLSLVVEQLIVEDSLDD